MNQGQQCSLFWVRLFPFLRWWPFLDRHTLRADSLAGLTGAIIVLPQGVAFATIAGLPPEYGLYSAMVPAIIAALFGSSWHLVSGPTTAISIVVFGALSPLAEPGSAHYLTLALTLTLLVGAVQLAMGLVRLGALVNFISHSVIVGFTAGAAILIASSQVNQFFGLHIPRGSSFYEVILGLFEQLGDINPYVTAVSLITVLAGVLGKRYLKRLPSMILAMLAGSLAALGLNSAFGEAATGIDTVGALAASLPPLSLPDFSPGTLTQLAPSALAISILALTEAVSIARSVAIRSQQRIDGNQEFVGQGLSNIVGSFFSSYASSGSFNRTGLNYEAGARTPMASILAAVSLGAILLLVAPLAAYLPTAAMAGILFLVAWGLIDFHHAHHIFKASKPEAAVLAVTFLATLFVELEFAIYVGVLLSLVLYLNRTAKPRIHAVVPNPDDPKRTLIRNPALPECPQVKVVRVDGSLFFGAVSHVEETLQSYDQRNPEQKHVLLLGSGINFIDVAGAEMLAAEANRRRALGGGLYLSKVKEEVCRILRDGGYVDTLDSKRIFTSKADALHEIVIKSVDPERCRRCTARIFQECAQMPQPAT